MSTARAELGRLLQRTLGLNAGAVKGSSVDEAVRKRMGLHEVRSRAKYLSLLRCSRQERIALVEAIELPAVGFFEHSESLVALQRWVTNHWLARPSKKPLRVLSVPCATGEEPYSLAITLLEAGLQSSHFHIDAADINDHALRRAAAAVYQDSALRLVTEPVRERYFQRELNGHRLAPQVRTQVSFLKSDLFGRMMLDTAYDIIFGRSLMMYFVPQAQQRILRRLETLLQPGGLLIVGPTLGRRGPRVSVPAWVEVLEQAHIPGRGGSRAVNQDAGDNRGQLREAATLLDAHRFEEAAGICIRVLDDHRASAQAVYLLGRIAEARGRHAEAREFFRRALYLQPRHRLAARHLSHLAAQRTTPRRKAA